MKILKIFFFFFFWVTIVKLDMFNNEYFVAISEHFTYVNHARDIRDFSLREIVRHRENEKFQTRLACHGSELLIRCISICGICSRPTKLSGHRDVATEKCSYCGEPEHCVSWDFGSAKNDRNFILDMQGMRPACIVGCLIKIAVFRHKCFTQFM